MFDSDVKFNSHQILFIVQVPCFNCQGDSLIFIVGKIKASSVFVAIAKNY